MITLYGLAISNYYNKVKLALKEKDIPFTEELTAPSRDTQILEKSPLGKIPFIKTPDGYLSESQAILEYLEEAFPDQPLFPTDTFQRAKCREFIQHLELNVELVARRLYGEVLFGTPVSAEVKEEVYTKLTTGLSGLARLFQFSPFALGARFGVADVVAWPHLQVVGYVTQNIYGKNLVIELIPGIEAYLNLIESRPHVQQVSADRTAARAKFFQNK
ncbi:glutathione S-transferase family protein [Methylomonas paludis]|uniref:Glutathione S-transferase family protein n=1 Tax=Methylomonas paludis TaxID=1173101 RepID=A0A975MPJ7_9GAMM|nr:glutathione S-transferase [Methylomonas paludis]QWF71124.1 glutathione S-transferase family protein [Methylomonas paludis]